MRSAVICKLLTYTGVLMGKYTPKNPVVDDDLECTSSNLQPNGLTRDVYLNLYLHLFSLLYISCSKTCYCLYISFNRQPESNTHIRSLLHFAIVFTSLLIDNPNLTRISGHSYILTLKMCMIFKQVHNMITTILFL
jgi:hypothetical protein